MRSKKFYYTLTFTHTFDMERDTVYFSHCFPYTYTDLTDDLAKLERTSRDIMTRSTLCRTLAGNRCEYLTITSKRKENEESKEANPKKGVLISARVHPGESNASWMMKGVIEFLVGNTPEAIALRDNFVFKIVPMLNPDGVINGNYRCSLVGQDLNRRWKNPSKILHPENAAVKRLMRTFGKEREIALVCDLHGHSRRKNIFMYGNNFDKQPHRTRVFPYILSKLCDYFSFE
jgi:cytosolic carboxypeptidase protein 2/3